MRGQTRQNAGQDACQKRIFRRHVRQNPIFTDSYINSNAVTIYCNAIFWLADSHHALDPQAWSEILAKREAARLRSGSNMSRPDEKALQMLDNSDSEGKGSPAITP